MILLSLANDSFLLFWIVGIQFPHKKVIIFFLMSYIYDFMISINFNILICLLFHLPNCTLSQSFPSSQFSFGKPIFFSPPILNHQHLFFLIPNNNDSTRWNPLRLISQFFNKILLQSYTIRHILINLFIESQLLMAILVIREDRLEIVDVEIVIIGVMHMYDDAVELML